MKTRKRPMEHEDAIAEQNEINQSIKKQFGPHVWHDMVHWLRATFTQIRRDFGNA